MTSPHELVTAGGAGTVCASAIQGTVDEPAAGSVKVGGLIVYVNTQGEELPSQLVYVQVYVFVPEQTGSAPSTGPEIAKRSPQLLVTLGGVGTVCASAIHATVPDPGAGNVNVEGSTVYV